MKPDFNRAPALEVSVLKKASLIFCALLVGVWIVSAQQAQTPPKAPADFKIPPEAAQKANPTKPTSESMAKAKKLYALDCAMCHGDAGDGKGDMASDIKGVTDFTNPDSMKDRTDGELFYIIRKGKGDMPPEGERAKDDDVWHLVNYVKAFAKK
jgi:mono/diheme cytochrome c family protein